jgi:hypothetical protein
VEAVVPETVPAPAKQPSKYAKNLTLLCEEEETEEPLELSINDVIINELSIYLTLKGFVTEHSCPIQFYKLNVHQLPNMARISKMLFCLTASSVTSECVFSTAGELISKKRTRLRPALAEELLMLSKNKFDQ